MILSSVLLESQYLMPGYAMCCRRHEQLTGDARVRIAAVEGRLQAQQAAHDQILSKACQPYTTCEKTSNCRVCFIPQNLPRTPELNSCFVPRGNSAHC